MPRGKNVIVKCQRSLESSDGVVRALFYDMGRYHTWMGPLPHSWKRLFDEFGDKFFARVTWRSGMNPKFLQKVPEQGW